MQPNAVLAFVLLGAAAPFAQGQDVGCTSTTLHRLGAHARICVHACADPRARRGSHISPRAAAASRSATNQPRGSPLPFTVIVGPCGGALNCTRCSIPWKS